MTDLERATSLVRKHRDPAMTAIAVANALAEARRAALEEAARVCERNHPDLDAWECGQIIRALKGKKET